VSFVSKRYEYYLPEKIKDFAFGKLIFATEARNHRRNANQVFVFQRLCGNSGLPFVKKGIKGSSCRYGIAFSLTIYFAI
jgi:hypothetical protein